MGRSGGSSGGHSSGGFGGGHSSGGFSGGGRSSGGSFGGGHSSRGAFGHGGHPSGGAFRHEGFYDGGPGWPRRPHYSSISSRIIVYVIVIIVIIGLFCDFAKNFSYINNWSNSSVQKNTTQRQKLFGVVNKTDWYEDQIGWIINKNTLISGLEDFYNKTGVQPYILFVKYSSAYWNGSTFDQTAAINYLEEVYQKKFTDEGHFLFAYFQCKNDAKEEMDGEIRYLSGYSADTIMDNEACQILQGYWYTNYYDTSLSIEELISNTFSETGKSIMSEPTNGWDVIKGTIIVIAIIIIIFIIYKIIKNKHKREKEKEEYTKEILDKPLETFGKDTSDLEDKYKN